MELTVAERIVLLNILPREGDFLSLKIVRMLREDLSFTEDEHKKLCFVQDGSTVKWETAEGIAKDIHIGEKAADIIVEALKKLNANKTLTDQHFTLYEKFVGD